MAKNVNRLTDRGVRALRAPGMHHDGDGLYLQILPGGGRTWIYRFMLARRARSMGLGSFRDVSLAQARIAREDARRLVKRGLDPIRRRQAEVLATGSVVVSDGLGKVALSVRARPAPTLLACWKAYVASREETWRGAKTKDSWMRSINSHAAQIKNRPVDEIDVEAVLQVLEPMWTTKAESAGKLRDRLERVLDYARVKQYRAGDNPAVWKTNLSHLLPPRPKLQRGHMRAVHYAKMPEVMRQLARKEGMAARALEFTILTVAREGMTLAATRAEIHEDLWSLEASRMKQRPFRQPLSTGALGVLKSVGVAKRRPNDLVFEGPMGGALSNSAMDKVLRDLDVDATPHGMRSSFRDWAGDETVFARETAEECLAHLVGDETERAYRRSDALRKRREVLQAWSDYCLGLGENEGGSVSG